MSEPFLVDKLWVESDPSPSSQPTVEELGCSSAPLTSMAFHFGTFCKAFNDDFILCKNETTDPAHCLKEGRRVTRCAIDFVKKLEEGCPKEWKSHWKCLDQNNQVFWKCRDEELVFNACVLKKMGLTKVLLDTPEGQTPVFESGKRFMK